MRNPNENDNLIKDFYKKLDEIYMQMQGEKVLEYLEESLIRARDLGDQNFIISVQNEKGAVHRIRGEVDKAKESYEELLKLLEDTGRKNSDEYARALINFGDVFVVSGEFQRAVDCFDQSEIILRENNVDESFEISTIYNNRGFSLFKLGYYDRAIEEINRAIDILGNFPNTEGQIATSYTNLSELLLEIREYDRAEEYLKRALAIFEDLHGGKDIHFPNALISMGKLKYIKGDYSSARYYYKRGISLLEDKIGYSKTVEKLRDDLNKIEKSIGEEED